MILIITSEAGDFSHLKIVDWLDYYGASYKIITGEGILTGEIEILIKDGLLICDTLPPHDLYKLMRIVGISPKQT